MTRALFQLTRKISLGLATSSAALCAIPAKALDLTTLLNSANQVTTQAGQLTNQAQQVRSMLPGQSPAAPQQQQQQQLQQNGLQGSTANLGAGRTNALAPAGQASPGSMQVVVAGQIQWRADGCSFTQSQEITCQFTAVNQGADKRMTVYPSTVSIVDAQGTEYRAAAGGMGQNESHAALFANGVPTIGIYHFRNIDPGLSAIKRLSLNWHDQIVWNDVALTSGGAGLSGLTGSTSGSSTSGLSSLTSLMGKTTTTTSSSTSTTTALATPSTATAAPAQHVRSVRPAPAASASHLTR